MVSWWILIHTCSSKVLTFALLHTTANVKRFRYATRQEIVVLRLTAGVKHLCLIWQTHSWLYVYLLVSPEAFSCTSPKEKVCDISTMKFYSINGIKTKTFQAYMKFHIINEIQQIFLLLFCYKKLNYLIWSSKNYIIGKSRIYKCTSFFVCLDHWKVEV